MNYKGYADMKHFILTPFPEYPECTLVAYLHDKSPELKIEARRTVVVCPGGAYMFLSDREAEPVALQFLAQGFNVFVLNYSFGEYAKDNRPIIEALRTVKFLREHAEEYDVNPDYVFMNGYSAGGHLAAASGTMYDLPEIREAVGCKDNDRHRPTATVLAYPVISSGEWAHRDSFSMLCGSHDATDEERAYYSVDKRVTPKTVPSFIWHTVEDMLVPVQNSLLYATALANSGVGFELHVYPHGPHGLVLANKETSFGQPELERPECEKWVAEASRWMMNL